MGHVGAALQQVLPPFACLFVLGPLDVRQNSAGLFRVPSTFALRDGSQVVIAPFDWVCCMQPELNARCCSFGC